MPGKKFIPFIALCISLLAACEWNLELRDDHDYTYKNFETTTNVGNIDLANGIVQANNAFFVLGTLGTDTSSSRGFII